MCHFVYDNQQVLKVLQFIDPIYLPCSVAFCQPIIIRIYDDLKTVKFAALLQTFRSPGGEFSSSCFDRWWIAYSDWLTCDHWERIQLVLRHGSVPQRRRSVGLNALSQRSSAVASPLSLAHHTCLVCSPAPPHCLEHCNDRCATVTCSVISR